MQKVTLYIVAGIDHELCILYSLKADSSNAAVMHVLPLGTRMLQ